MFRNWGFLLGEIWVLLFFAAILGLTAGWLIWSRRAEGIDTEQLEADLAQCRAMQFDKEDRIRALEAELAEAQRAAGPRISGGKAADDEADFMLNGGSEAPATLTSPQGEPEAVRPAALEAPLSGTPDDLKRIKGIGPKLETLCHRLGFYHFSQIAAWTPEEVGWVDAHLEEFKGRVTRDDWVAQAKVLAEDDG